MNSKLQHEIALPVRDCETGADALQETKPVATESEPFAMLRRGAKALERSWSGPRATWASLAAWRRAAAIARDVSRQQQPLTQQDD